jgi:hypothetical protein
MEFVEVKKPSMTHRYTLNSPDGEQREEARQKRCLFMTTTAGSVFRQILCRQEGNFITEAGQYNQERWDLLGQDSVLLSSV